ncbi:hypothetical protein FGSG_08035 [Fusarium graminearum PH-1]|uniref:Chromosome 2, complete genome n=1 Tax=Gibberella zeae (strain ATCC MYA-4620 / CBS 123657 / FGSC 9075 / NRRL 31084 / PH-1) TaxID=229533 RepID=I1RUX6_GIBZE|nr:hypothetical protein FGSG_08035 [Fusarium graminearum PH-1]ESU15364.1 hypothetical protein FGSG_08035 [Fusarium graminearum PH-1]CEF76287.1 unnamed protein product [Fusarium graminearum]|eukprot:XP_011320789.1 hypothetical protein FGSG_08035 [Fusarium graminearum PH-1]
MPSKILNYIPSRANPSCQVEIDIHGHYESKVYTTGSTVQGFIRLTSRNKTPFQSIQVNFRGTASTRQAFQYGTPFTTHAFMNISISILEDFFPTGHVLEAGESHSIPFIFEIPSDLSSNACSHQNTAVRERHLLPPPSLGSWMKSDLTDGSTYVDYGIRARLVLGNDGFAEERFVDQNISLKVIPMLPEQPPISISTFNSQYCLFQTKTIRRNLVGAKEGILRVSTRQPRQMTLNLDHLQASESQLAIDLEYIPLSTRRTPPDIRIKSAVIETVTSFSVGRVGYLPDQDDTMPSSISGVAPWVASHPLVLQGAREVNWEKVADTNPFAEPERRASEPIQVAPDTARTQTPPSTTRSSIDKDYSQSETLIYRATITQPFVLPTEKLLFLPTFHSCMVSRTYRIRITLATRAHGTTVSLVVPFQITSEGRTTAYDPILPVYQYDSDSVTRESPPPYSR